MEKLEKNTEITNKPVAFLAKIGVFNESEEVLVHEYLQKKHNFGGE